ncbi:MAG: PilZ domain-containing protein [Terriglobales bacterium]|jgi:c-di-GMP-binding flagellar brake protein YcgR
MPENRQATRFPLHLPVAVKAKNQRQRAETEDISSGGVLLSIDSDVKVGSSIAFTIRMPADVVGSDKDVLVNCTGRVVRTSKRKDRRAVGVVIDEYDFERR